jgi:hypothetical protein
MSQLKTTIRFCGLFEAELLVDLMLRYWNHPLLGDKELMNYLVEAASEILKRSKGGDVFFEEIDPEDMNFVAAVWYAEFCHVQDSNEPDVEKRRDWLQGVRRSLPSCFCDPDDLELPHGTGDDE